MSDNTTPPVASLSYDNAMFPFLSLAGIAILAALTSAAENMYHVYRRRISGGGRGRHMFDSPV